MRVKAVIKEKSGMSLDDLEYLDTVYELIAKSTRILRWSNVKIFYQIFDD